ncbi:uncharacterized protein [Nicotiana tomentosiformis]|uniref:uncharacterized protein n=1 Tax=Nicotiana tomentosiformis TaxID=4098 RepID=UPI00388CC31F
MAIELSEYDIIYQPITAIKSQVLAYFVADFSMNLVPEAEKELQVFTGANPGTWTLFTNGSSNVKGEGLGIILIPPLGEVIRQGTYVARETQMQEYLEKVRKLLRQFQTWKVVQIPKEENAEADALANFASVANATNTENVVVVHLLYLALDQTKSEINFNNLTWDWRNELVNFLQDGILPEDKNKSQLLRLKAAQYCLICGNLYRKIFGGPLARCLEPSQTEYVMREVHEGHYGNHTGGRSLVKTLIRARYYWPKMEEEAENFVTRCDKCPRYANNMHRPVELLHSVKSPWPFMKWGMDIIGSLPQAKEKIGEPSTRYTHTTEATNEEDLRVNLDLTEERREAALIRMADQKQMIEQYYNRKANLRYVKIGEFVLKKIFRSTKAGNAVKLRPNWEDPYRIRGIVGKGAY